MRGSNKPNVIANIKETIRRIDEQIQKDSTGNAWMVLLQKDLHALLAEAEKLSGEEMDQKFRDLLTKHQPEPTP